jgi:ribose transport system substrate-binding protein
MRAIKGGESRVRIRFVGAGRARALAAAVAVLGLLAAGCGSSTGGSGSSGSSSIAAGKELATLRAAVAAAQKVPTFTSPGPAIKDVAALRGDKIMSIPGSSQLAACEQMSEAEQSLGQQVGTPVTIWQNDGLTSQWEAGIETAISQGYKAVILTCSINPLSIVPALEDAESHGVKVICYAVNYAVNSRTYPGLASGVGEHVLSDAKLMVEQAFVHSGGKPFNMLLITSSAVNGEPLDVAAVKSEMNALCGSACKIYSEDIEVPDWATKIQTTVQSELLTHPDITVVFPLFSGEYLFALPAIESSHRSNVILTGGFGNGTPEIQLQLAAPGNKIAIGQMSSYADWAAYSAYYQTTLVLAGQTPVAFQNTATPNILTTPANAAAVLTGTGAYGDAFVNGYRKLYGLPPLSGQALISTAKVGQSAE